MSKDYLSNLLGAFATTVSTRIEQEIAELGGRSLSHESALVTIGNHPNETIDVLSKVLNITHSGTVRLINTLEDEGLVERRRSDQDARAVVLHLTPKGDAHAKKVLQARERVTSELLDHLDPEQQKTIITALENSMAALTDTKESARRICRLCDEGVCRPQGCPVEQAACGNQRN